ncbi:MAG: tRNA-dihydrouridine synthase family protein [Lachnospiraceae bacterium]|nr:tRNA-dihydrouridine synthase family protein [Lachnospiraceae bacterium]
MKIYLAPMEGITGYVYRNALHNLCNGKIDKYYTPFIAPRPKKGMHDRERRDLLPENNQDVSLVPQILTNSAPDFTNLATEIHELYGYQEINLNLGCPSKTVVSRGKGSGFLSNPKELDHFLMQIFDQRDKKGQQYDISLKTRLGVSDPDEIWNLLSIYEKYPVSELTVHVRVQSDYYKKPARMSYMSEIKNRYPGELAYNGDIFTVENYAKCTDVQEMPLMLGRGVIRNPFLPLMLKGVDVENQEAKERLKVFHKAIYEGYQADMDIVPVIFHMKELWAYIGDVFVEADKARKHLRKAKNRSEYEEAVREMFHHDIDLKKNSALGN